MNKEKLLERIGDLLPQLRQYPLERIGVMQSSQPRADPGQLVLLLQFSKEKELEMKVLEQTMDFLEKELGGDLEIIFGFGAENIDEMEGLSEEDLVLL